MKKPNKVRGGRYNFRPHSGQRERNRRLRQSYRGQLPPAQFRSRTDYEAAQMLYLALVADGQAA